jgi:hypothetical protein
MAALSWSRPPVGVYLFLHEGRHAGGGIAPNSPEVDAGQLGYLFSDDHGVNWSDVRSIALPDRDISMFPDRIHGHLNHPPQLMPGGRVVLPLTQYARLGSMRRDWQLVAGETAVLWCENILTESRPGPPGVYPFTGRTPGDPRRPHQACGQPGGTSSGRRLRRLP